MGVESAVNIADLRRRARRRLPWILRDYMDGGSEDERAIASNLAQFARYRLVPRYFVDIAGTDTAIRLWDREYAMPLGIAPTGYPGLFRPEGDLLLARGAMAMGVPFIMSGAGTTSIEAVARTAPGTGWFQLAPTRDPGIAEDKIRRAADAGIDVMVVMADVPTAPKRERDVRNGFDMPFRLRARTVLDGLLHPRWSLTYLATGGLPMMENWAPYAPPGAGAADVATYAAPMFFGTLTWPMLERFRALWPRKLVVKGILDTDDARRVAEAGCDGLIVSNHGGRQGDRLPAPLEVLPSVAAAAPNLAVMMDGGVRRGADVVTAVALGARMCFVGRPTLYGLVCGGQRGVEHALRILKEEMLVTLRQIGRPRIADLDASVLLDTEGRG
jgi:L-lactate dehydrogenase (cytochrome)/(S)-mandelate dehydrogenase